MTTTDFSSILPINNNVYSFNPSIAHWKDDLYLCSYREFVRYRSLFQRGTTNTGITYNYTVNKIVDPNHPWLGGAKEICYTKILDGFDDTKMCIIQIDPVGSVVNLITSIIYDENGNILQNIDGVDARLLKIGEDKFLLSYNTTSIQQNGTSCILISTRIIQVTDDFRIIIHPETIVCNDSNCHPKNWSVFLINVGNIVFSYELYPITHYMYLKLEENTLTCVGEQNVNAGDNIFSKLTNYYESLEKTHEPAFYISVSTPSVPFYHNILLGVGHIKYNYTRPLTFSPENFPPLIKFCEEMFTAKKLIHTKYIYMMFFYEFDIYDAKIISCTDIFIPPSTGTYCFPSGLTINNNDQVILSYGDNDDKCMFLTFTRQEVKDLLDTQNILLKEPRDVDFYMF